MPRTGLSQIRHMVGYSVSKDFTSENPGQTVLYVLEQDTRKKGSHASMQHFYVQRNPGKLSASRFSPNRGNTKGVNIGPASD